MRLWSLHPKYLDPQGLVALWREQSPTIFFITHSVEEAIYLADRIVVMAQRPAVFSEVITVPFGKNRTADMRLANEFIDLRRHIEGQLKH